MIVFKFDVGPGNAAIGAAVVTSTHSTDRPYLAVMYRSGDFRVWDLKTEQPVISATLRPPPMVNTVMEMEEERVGFICLAAPKPSNKTTSARDIVAVSTFEQIVIVPCKPPTDGSNVCKKLTDSVVSYYLFAISVECKVYVQHCCLLI